MYVLLPHFSNFFRTIYLFEVYHCLLSLIIYFSIFLPGFGTICQILFSGIFQARQTEGILRGAGLQKSSFRAGCPFQFCESRLPDGSSCASCGRNRSQNGPGP
ncbi:hypothetical protein B4099_1623 [Heyndrickxia coagulans]|uniref:Uncharacterized protein n=1 Tax=Heyndrickxia coagulans TaxID=1398 RepID=A0A150KID4_HEYCO|nr:hypothetical protein B4099_1623 [Heyndrickxia coagulans]